MSQSLFPTAFLIFSVAGGLFAQVPVIGSCTILPADNVWNTPIDTLPVSPNSTAYITTVGPAAPVHADFGSGTWNGAPIGIPFLRSPGTQPKFSATFLYWDESDPGPYAIPLTVPIEGGSNGTGDRHAISVDVDNCILYELYRAFPQSNTWNADAGAIFNLKSNALRTSSWTSADAAGLPIMPGLLRYDEVAAGEIRHAIRFTVPQTLRAFIWPARHYASSLTDPRYPPMGQRFRLKASFDISPFPPDVQVILRALKKYGMILADNGSPWFLSGEPDARWNNTNLGTMRNISGASFEAIDESSLMLDVNSGQARQQSGPSVSVSPSSVTLVTQTTRQFSASVQNSTDQSVNWSVNGILGGNSQLGIITAAGLYTAPAAVPSPAAVTVQANMVSSPLIVGSATVTIRNFAPFIASVSPNPVTVGSFTITVTGSGFQPGAEVRWNGAALATTFVSSSKVTATGTASAPSTAVAITVANPDGQQSNSSNISVAGTVPAPIAISPTTATVALNRTKQFTANMAVTWKVNGVAGGSTMAGRISTAGLYTAPAAKPSPNTVTVTAVSAADPTKSASATVTIVRR